MPSALTDVDTAIAAVIVEAIQDERKVAFIARSRQAAILRFKSLERAIPREAISRSLRTSGNERIELLNGSSFRFLSARSYGGLRGYSLDIAIIDSDADGLGSRDLYLALLARSGRHIEVVPL